MVVAAGAAVVAVGVPRAAAQGSGQVRVGADLVDQARTTLLSPPPGPASYSVRALDRWSAYLPTSLSERLLYRRELEARVSWSRMGERSVELVGARELRAFLGGSPRILASLSEEALDLTWEPGRARRYVGLGTFRLASHPLLPSNAVHYRFTAVDTTSLRLPAGDVHLVRVAVVPVGDDAMVSGFMWIEAGSAQVVREAYRRRPEAARGDGTSIPLVGEFSFEMTGVAVEYGRWSGNWLPRAVALEGWMQVGELGSVRIEYRRAYLDYAVESGEGSPTHGTPSPGKGPSEIDWTVVVPTDSIDLLTPPGFPESMFASDRQVFGNALREVDEFLPTSVRPLPRRGGTYLAFPRLDLLRYSRPAGASIGAEVLIGSREWALRMMPWVQTATPWWTLELSAIRSGEPWSWSVEAYRRAQAIDQRDNGLSPAAALTALVLGFDPLEYQDVAGGGVTLGWRPGSDRGGSLGLSFEAQRPIRTEASFSIPEVWGGPGLERQLLETVRADQVRASLWLWRRAGIWADRGVLRADLRALYEGGSFAFARARLELRGRVQVRQHSWFELETAIGGSRGAVPPQGLHLLGGVDRVAGYAGSAAAGENAAWARASVGRLIGRIGVSLFGHAGRAWTASAAKGLASAGLTFESPGGVLMLDFARALLAPAGWSVTLRSNLGRLHR